MTVKKEEKAPVVNMQKKLSTNKICGKIKIMDILSKDEPSKDLYEVVGIATGTKDGATDYGPWIALSGNFAAHNIETGERFRSGVCFLPDVALDPVIGQLNGGAHAVEFGWTIGIKLDDSSTVGYVYYARPIIEADENDPLELLAAKMGTAPALEDKRTAKK